MVLGYAWDAPGGDIGDRTVVTGISNERLALDYDPVANRFLMAHNYSNHLKGVLIDGSAGHAILADGSSFGREYD